jgi:cytochrome P450
MADYAHPFTFGSVCRVIGVPEEDITTVSDIVGKLGSPYLACIGTDHKGRYAAFTGYLYDLIADRRGRAGDDLISCLTAIANRGHHYELGGKCHFDTAELVNLIVLLLYAGHVNMMNFIGNAIRVLGQRPEVCAALRRAPEKMGDAFLELLRFDSPVQFILLVARETFALHDQTINSGDRIRACVGSANRDPVVHVNPDLLDLTRRPRQQVAFGAGPLRCIGARLAQLEGTTALASFLHHVAEFTLPQEPLRWRTGTGAQRGLYALPVEQVTYAAIETSKPF